MLKGQKEQKEQKRGLREFKEVRECREPHDHSSPKLGEVPQSGGEVCQFPSYY